MKKTLKVLVFLLALGLVLGLAGCDEPDKDNGRPDWASDFSNYPNGRVDTNAGRLTVNNTIAAEILLFDGSVEGKNYLGTVKSLGSVKLRMLDEKFYTIVAVQKDNYIERRGQAAQFSELTYYSNIQPYTISMSPSNTYGGGNWVFINNTNFWVEVKKTDLSMNYAVIAPGANRVSIPIALNEGYPYYLYFRRELKYDNKVIALVETTDRSQANTAIVNTASPTFTTTINNVDASANTKPAVMVINRSTQTVETYYSNTLKTNGAPGGTYWIAGGQHSLISGFEAGDETQIINFSGVAWEQNRYVPSSQNIVMQNNKAYDITIPPNGEASGITVVEVEASKYFN